MTDVPCPRCADAGWCLVLPAQPGTGPAMLELVPCPVGCDAAARPLAGIGLGGMFRRVVTRPGDRAIMAVTGTPTVGPGPDRPTNVPATIPPPSPFPPGSAPRHEA